MPDNLYGYHVHIYHDAATEAASIALQDRLVAEFDGQRPPPQFVGIAGPHPVTQRAVILPKAAFTGDLVSWLMFNRQGLNLLIHPLTDDEVEDHSTHAVWLGTPVDLDMAKLAHSKTIDVLMPT